MSSSGAALDAVPVSRGRLDRALGHLQAAVGRHLKAGRHDDGLGLVRLGGAGVRRRGLAVGQRGVADVADLVTGRRLGQALGVGGDQAGAHGVRARLADRGQDERPVHRVPAGEPVLEGLPGQRRLLGPALVRGARAPGGEPAALRRAGQVGRQPGNGVQRLAGVLLELRNRGEQGLGVGVVHLGEQLVRLGGLHHPARVHHVDPVRVPGDHAHVVRDQQHGHAQPVLQVPEQGEDLRLDGDVQRRGGLVGDQQLGLAGQRHGDHHALAQPAGQLVRIVAEPLLRPGQADQRQHLDRAVQRLGLRGAPVQPYRLAHLVADGLGRVQRGERILEDHRDLVAPDPAQLLVLEADQLAVVELDGAADDGPARRQQPHDRQPGHGLAAARLPDDAEGLPGVHVQVDVSDSLYDGAGELDVRRQVLDVKDWGHEAATSRNRWL